MKQVEVDIRQKEVGAREREVSSAHLKLLYSDLRQDLRDAKEEGDAEEVQQIKNEMTRVT